MKRRDTLLIVDDMEVNRTILRNVFEQEYDILEAKDGQQALTLLEQYSDQIVAVLLDLVMPMKDGYQVLEEMKEQGLLARIPAVVVTAENFVKSELRALDLGASDIIPKPFEPQVIRRRVQNIIELNRHRWHLEDLVEEQAQSLRDSNEAMIDALSSIIEHRSAESGQHVLRIRMFTKILLENMAQNCPEYNLDEHRINMIASAACMHDIGKIAIPDAILNKPGRLTPEEFEIMKTHTVKGGEILAGLSWMSGKEYLHYAYSICRYHHERWDGSGYPDGLKGDNIPVCAQAVGIADCYDALTSKRVYKEAFSLEQAFHMILNGECGAFSPKLLRCFQNVRGQFEPLAKAYADGRSPKTDCIQPVNQSGWRERLDTAQMGQSKYFALLRYMDATVMEADLSTNTCRIAYLSSNDFALLCTSGRFEKAIWNFAEGAVHPQDRPAVLNLLNTYISQFLEDGVIKRSRRYRVLDRSSREYRVREATILRMDIEDPSQQKVIIIWKELDQGRALRTHSKQLFAGPLLQGLLGGIQRCRNDRWLTFTDMDESFLKLVGYTAEEIQEKFHNRMLEMILPEDRKDVIHSFREQIRVGHFVELEYRIRTREGFIWVLEKGRMASDERGDESIYCILMDITQSKQAQEELRLMVERHKIIMDQTSDIIFEWDIPQKRLVYAANWEKKFGYSLAETWNGRIASMKAYIHPDDLSCLAYLLQHLHDNVPYSETELRILKKNGRYLWCRIRASMQYGAAGRPIKLVGVILDIDSEKRASQALREKAEQDALTKLYNKTASRRQIERYLLDRPEGEQSAMLILDLDDFKQANDRYGHMFGDAVLMEVAGGLRHLFREEDILSRIGGDEFTIFLKRIPGADLVEKRAGQVISTVRTMLWETVKEFRVSCSIGIAVCPQDGVTFWTLFQRADQALYQAKRQGKGMFVRYKHRHGSSLEAGQDRRTAKETDKEESQ